MSIKTIRNLILLIAFTILVGGIGYRLGERQATVSFTNFKPEVNLKNTASPANFSNTDFSLFWNVWNRLDQDYLDKKSIDPQKMVYGAISGMVASLGDPYTVFLPPQQQKASKEDLSGQFEGIGAELGSKDNRIVVMAPLKDTPAEKAGIKAGDYILKVDNKDTTNWTLPETVDKIRGQKGTKVVLNILHVGQDKPVDISIVRDTITVKSVTWEKKDNIAVLKLSRFGDQTDDELSQAASEIASSYSKGEVKGMILDLRNNPGGYLSGAVFVAGEFLPQGDLVVQQENAAGQKESYSVDRQGQLLDIPLMVLINKGSASASEIVSGALRDNKRAKLVGETSFGKGSVQEAEDLPNGAGIHITIARWLLPKGDWITGKGIKPDVEVALDDKNPTKDTQLEKAIELLK